MRFRREIMVGICFVGFGLGGVGIWRVSGLRGRHIWFFFVSYLAFVFAGMDLLGLGDRHEWMDGMHGVSERCG